MDVVSPCPRNLVAPERGWNAISFQDFAEPADAAVIRRITRYTHTRTEYHSCTTHAHTYTHTCAPRRARLNSSLGDAAPCTRVWGTLNQPGCYYRRVPTTSSARPTSTIVCTYIHRYSPPSSLPSASLYLFISVYYVSPRRFPSRTSLPFTSRRAPCDPDCYTNL